MSSANVHPSPHISTGFEYLNKNNQKEKNNFMGWKHNFWCSIISGDYVFSEFLIIKSNIPSQPKVAKSLIVITKTSYKTSYHILISQVDVASILLGFKSRWITLAEWRNLSPRKI